MNSVKCPTCQAVLPEKELAGGWCETCGKRIPAAVVSQSGIQSDREAWRTEGEAPSGGRRFFDGSRALLCLIGLALITVGYKEWKVSLGSDVTPADVDLARLEAGDALPQQHVRIGKHVRLYPATIYVIEQRDKREDDPPIKHSFFPIISVKNSLFDRLAEFDEAGKDNDRQAAKPQLRDFKVLVKTGLYQRVSAIPREITTEEGISGLIINRIDSLRSDEAALIREQFPFIDTDQLLILEAGRQPKSLVHSLGMVAIGLMLFLPALVTLVRRRSLRSPAK
jgi:hypothetical protein